MAALRTTALKSWGRLLNRFSCDDLAEPAKPEAFGGQADDVNARRSGFSSSFKLKLIFLSPKEDRSKFSPWAAVLWPKSSCCVFN